MTSDTRNHLDALGPEDRDALLSAYALGELEGADRDHVERLLADPAADDARRIVAESRAVAEALREAHAADVAPRSPDLRRAIVAALAGSGTAGPTVSPAPRNRLSGWFALAGVIAATALVAVTLVRESPVGRDVARRDEAAPQAAAPAGNPPAEPAVTSSAARQGTPAGGDAIAAESGDTLAPLAPRVAEARSLPRSAGGKAAAAAPADATAAESTEVFFTEETAPEVTDDEALVAILGPVRGSGGGGYGGRAAAPAPPRRTRGDVAAADGLDVTGAPRLDELAARRVVEERRADRERFGRFEENRFVAVADRPLSTFSIDVDTASYAVTRRFLASGHLPPADAVRIEEFVNYFPYAYPRPAGDEPFAVALEAADCPWRAGHRLVRIGIAGRDIDRAQRPAGNLVFLVDVSGSMDEPDKLPLVKQALALLVEELTENDRVSIVTYAGDAGLRLPPTSGDQKRRILDVVEGLSAGGSTHGSAGIELAYEQARERFIPGGANRVILCTDGDLNVGVTSDAALVDLVQARARGGVFLTVLGFGRGNLQDEKLEAIADKGNGVYAYIDGVREARKVLVEQLTGSTITIAKDVKIQVEFNPAQVASYRLLGYENRRLADADFRDDKKDAGEIGAGHTVTAVYEIVPAGGAEGAATGPDAGAEPLKYQDRQTEEPRAAEPAPAGPASRELLTVKLRFKEPEGDTSVLREFPLADAGGTFANASADTRFAAAVAAFGMILRKSEFRGDATLGTVSRIALDALGTDAGGHRAEFLDLVRQAETLVGREDK